jgi:SAM-dependent methyltransferase
MSDLPPQFERQRYREHNPDLRHIADADLERHYRDSGEAEGRLGSAVGNRAAFFALAAGAESILEIGPLASPSVLGPNVKYFDVVDTDALKDKARGNGMDPRTCPEIDYVSAIGDIGVVDETFDAVVSSHVVEHQPDLVAHLAGVAKLLNPAGRYFLAIPDKRYCFDHFIATSTIADILDAFSANRRLHSAASVIEHLVMTTHNDAVRHWNGDHGEPAWRHDGAIVRHSLLHAINSNNRYIDTHAWQFTPNSFHEIMQLLSDIGLSPFKLCRTYQTLRNTFEFYVVLEKVRDEIDIESYKVPDDFDGSAYLEANPDVARAQVDPAAHYLQFGRREGRRLKV